MLTNGKKFEEFYSVFVNKNHQKLIENGLFLIEHQATHRSIFLHSEGGSSVAIKYLAGPPIEIIGTQNAQEIAKFNLEKLTGIKLNEARIGNETRH